MTVLDVELGRCRLRSFRPGDEAALQRHADNWEIARWLRDSFPHPYSADAAAHWVAYASGPGQPWVVAIDVDGEVAGCVGLTPGTDVFGRSAEIGYWIGEPFWGRGLAPLAVQALVDWTWANTPFERLHAGVFSGNERSGKVLLRCGFHLESVRARGVYKAGAVLDEWVYVCLRP